MIVGGLFDGWCGVAMASADVDEGVGESVVVNLLANAFGDAEECWLICSSVALSGLIIFESLGVLRILRRVL